MSKVVVSVHGISKQYRIGTARRWLGEVVTCGAKRLLGMRAPKAEHARRRETVWALKDVSFEVERGTVLSIIGRNGSGKTTLLKILSRITRPTEGSARIVGRVGSLLDVGTGFHPELTGRENIHLNGAVLGMTRSEIRRKFDEIVSFAELERFIDTPVKHYSRGMFVRLAFGVAAHLDSEILFVDEALSVGDAAFQKRCLGRIEDITRCGRTVLFVSHDLTTVACLSKRAIWLDQGVVRLDGRVDEVIRHYIHEVAEASRRGECSIEARPDLPFSITSVRTSAGNGATGVVPRSAPLIVTIRGTVHELRPLGEELLVAVDIKTENDLALFRTHNIEQRRSGTIPRQKGPFELRCVVPPELLTAGTYRLGLLTAIAGKQAVQELYPLLEFEIVQDRLIADVYTSAEGFVTPRCEWSL